MSPAEPRPANARRVTPLLVATGISVTGDGAVLAAAPLLAAALTQDPIAVSAVTAGFYLPWLVFSLPAGALVDRWPRRRVMVSTDLLRFAVLAGLVGMIAARRITVPLLVIAAILVGMAQTFFDSAAQAIIPAVVGREKENLARVNGRYWAVDTMGRTLLGPPLGSALLALRRVLPFAVDALSFLASAALVRLLPEPASARGPRERVDAAVRAGMRHLFQTRDLRVDVPVVQPGIRGLRRTGRRPGGPRLRPRRPALGGRQRPGSRRRADLAPRRLNRCGGVPRRRARSSTVPHR